MTPMRLTTDLAERGRGRIPGMRLRRSRLLSLAFTVACLGFAAQGTVLAAQLRSPHPVFNGFLPAEIYVVEVNGVPSAEAQITIADRLPAVLVVAPELASAVMLTPRTGMVQSLGTEFVVHEPDGTVALWSDVALVNEGRFQVVGRDVSFSVGTDAVVLKEKPFLLGLQDVAAMESYSSGYLDRERVYAPSISMLDELRSFPADVRVRVYFGSWCPFCSMFVPRMMKVGRELEGSRIQLEYYGLPQPATDDPITDQHGIEAVPTGIVYIGGEEAGRISGNMWQSPETALKVLLANHR